MTTPFIKDIIKNENTRISENSSASFYTQQYILDTNILREFLQHYLPEHLFPELWTAFNRLLGMGLITSLDTVKEECLKQVTSPEGVEWIHNHDSLFVEPSGEELIEMQKITEYNEFQLTKKEISGDKTKADLNLVAKGKVTQGIVVSIEKYQPHGRKIPTMCERFEIPYLYRDDFILLLRSISESLKENLK